MDDDELIDLRVARKWLLAPDVLGFELTAHGAGVLPAFEPGAHVEVEVFGAGSSLFRPYSLCNSPRDTHRYVIAVKRERAGKGGSAWLHDHLLVGHTLQSSRPINNFSLYQAAVHSVLLAGGIGIAPLLSMAEDLHRRAAPFELHYSARSGQLAAFAQGLEMSPLHHNLRCHWSETTGGHIDFNQIFASPPRLSHIYVCGPAGYTASAIRCALADGREPDKLHFESFN